MKKRGGRQKKCWGKPDELVEGRRETTRRGGKRRKEKGREEKAQGPEFLLKKMVITGKRVV